MNVELAGSLVLLGLISTGLALRAAFQYRDWHREARPRRASTGDGRIGDGGCIVPTTSMPLSKGADGDSGGDGNGGGGDGGGGSGD